MTREEKISELIRHRKEVQNDFGWNTSLLCTLDVAIEALKNDFTADDARVLFNRCRTLISPIMCLRCGLSEKCKKYREVLK